MTLAAINLYYAKAKTGQNPVLNQFFFHLLPLKIDFEYVLRIRKESRVTRG